MNWSARAELSRSLVGEIRIAARRLHRVVGNLLDITRIETGSIRAKSEWCDLEDVIGDAVARVGEEISGRRVSVDVAEAVATLQTDAGLLEEVLRIFSAMPRSTARRNRSSRSSPPRNPVA